jgi:hypothetical protein
MCLRTFSSGCRHPGGVRHDLERPREQGEVDAWEEHAVFVHPVLPQTFVVSTAPEAHGIAIAPATTPPAVPTALQARILAQTGEHHNKIKTKC